MGEGGGQPPPGPRTDEVRPPAARHGVPHERRGRHCSLPGGAEGGGGEGCEGGRYARDDEGEGEGHREDRQDQGDAGETARDRGEEGGRAEQDRLSQGETAGAEDERTAASEGQV